MKRSLPFDSYPPSKYSRIEDNPLIAAYEKEDINLITETLKQLLSEAKKDSFKELDFWMKGLYRHFTADGFLSDEIVNPDFIQKTKHLHSVFEESIKIYKAILHISKGAPFFFSSIQYPQALELVLGQKTLTTLHLNDNKVGDEGVKALAEALKTNKTLTTLYLDWNKIGNTGAEALAEALKTNKTLTALDLSCNDIGNMGAGAILEALRTNKTLTTLHLGWNEIDKTGAEAILEALRTNKTLTTLHLGGNYLGDEGAKAIAEALITNKTLTTLYLGNSKLGVKGAKAIAEALITNKTLTTLYLGENNIGVEGAKAIAEALITNKTLTTLHLEESNIGDEGVEAIAEALKTNKTLTRLHLEGENDIGDAGAEAILEALRTNTTLTTLSLEEYNIENNILANLDSIETQLKLNSEEQQADRIAGLTRIFSETMRITPSEADLKANPALRQDQEVPQLVYDVAKVIAQMAVIDSPPADDKNQHLSELIPAGTWRARLKEKEEKAKTEGRQGPQ
ncbi:MAG: family protein 3-like [Rickettsiales bacterium]|nr:family protein 3-like [Rickettsiales bacterium]